MSASACRAILQPRYFHLKDRKAVTKKVKSKKRKEQKKKEKQQKEERMRVQEDKERLSTKCIVAFVAHVTPPVRKDTCSEEDTEEGGGCQWEETGRWCCDMLTHCCH